MPHCEHANLTEPPKYGHPAQPAKVAEPGTDEKGDPQDARDDRIEPALADVTAPDCGDREGGEKNPAAEPQHRKRTSHRTVDTGLLESRQQPAQRIEPRCPNAQTPYPAGMDRRPTP